MMKYFYLIIIPFAFHACSEEDPYGIGDTLVSPDDTTMEFQLNIESSPSNSLIYINNVEIGTTPISYVSSVARIGVKCYPSSSNYQIGYELFNLKNQVTDIQFTLDTGELFTTTISPSRYDTYEGYPGVQWAFEFEELIDLSFIKITSPNGAFWDQSNEEIEEGILSTYTLNGYNTSGQIGSGTYLINLRGILPVGDGIYFNYTYQVYLE